MNNYAIADNFSLLGKLIDIHGDDSFKAKSYTAAAFAIEKLPSELIELPRPKIFAIRGIGTAIGNKIIEQFETGRLGALDEYILKTPAGILEMLKIKGLGPKKIATIWKELGIENLGELLYACEENRLLLYKGFGAKSQESIKESISFYISNQGSYLYRQIEAYAHTFTQKMQEEFAGKTFLITGDFIRQSEVIHKLEWVTDTGINVLEKFFAENKYEVSVTEHVLSAKGSENVLLEFYTTSSPLLYTTAFARKCSVPFFEAWQQNLGWDANKKYVSEEAIFEENALAIIPPCLRESPAIIEEAKKNNLPAVILPNDIKGIIHTHSNWSDGSDIIEKMATSARDMGMEYLVISDHSKTAFYAQGLYPEKVKAQHELIDALNKKFAPFKIFKSIESDILNDGSLDYDEEVLSTFDLVIASIHSNFKMSEEKATARIITAVSNPYTTILGHMTGRLLLARNGYPVNHEAVINACVQHNVAIELNAHSRRLDMDWRYIPQAIQKGAIISINPDAHAVEEFDYIKYGVLVAQKAGLTAANNLSSFTLQQFEDFLAKQKTKRN